MIRLLVLVTVLGLWTHVTSAATCSGVAIPTTPSVLMPPVVPQPRGGSDIVGFNVQNNGSATLGRRYVTTAQFFKRAQVHPSVALVARMSGTATAVQLDVLSLWDDGSVKLGSLTFMLPAMCANALLPVLLSTASASDPTLAGLPPVNLITAPFTLTAAMTFRAGQYSGQRSVDLAAIVKKDLADPTHQDEYWLRGPLVTQARVERRQDSGPLRVTADISVYADGNVAVDVMFNNDLTEVRKGTWASALPPQHYTATVTLNGKANSATVAQYQFQNWITRLRSDNARLNIQKDLAYLEQAGAVLPYDQSTGVSNSTVANLARCASNTPLAANCLVKYMPTTGGRGDIGYTTLVNTTWLLTGDARIADTALAQGDAGGAIPWNFRLINGRWVTPVDDPQVWIDERATVSIANQPDFSGAGWTWDTAHQPNLAFVPYIMTGQRWYLDRLNAQAAFALTSNWPVPRCGNGTMATCDLAIDFAGQVRSQAWSIREIVQAGYIGRPGTWEKAYFVEVSARNWRNLRLVLQPRLTVAQGEVLGWVYGANRGAGQTPLWSQDFLTGVAVIAARLGEQGATQFIDFQRRWLSARFTATGQNPYNGCGYQLTVGNDSDVPFKTWQQVTNAMRAQNLDAGSPSPWNGRSGWDTGGNFCQIAYSALGAALTIFPEDPHMSRALDWLKRAGERYVNQPAFRVDPTFNVVPLGH